MIVVVGAMVFAVIATISLMRARDRAETANAQLRQQIGDLRGNVDRRKVRVFTFTEGSGDSQSTYTGYRVSFPPLGLGLKITQQGFWGKVRKAFGSRDIEVGDQEFDSPKTLVTFALGLLLFTVTLLLNVIALYVVRKYREQYE